MRRHQQVSIVTLLALLLLCGEALAQLVTGSISGSVTDASGGAVAGAKVTVINERTGEARAAHSNDAGAFNFPALQPSAYTIKVERQGFRSLERKNLILTANDKLSLGDLELQVGQVTEVLQVTAEGSLVKTASSENSALLSATQLDLQQAKGRDVVSLLRVLPRVSYQAGQTGGTFDSDSLGGTYGTFTPNISGTRSRWNTFTLDGQTGSDADIVEAFNGSTSMDAIEEVKVLFNNYQAEFGRNTGGTRKRWITAAPTAPCCRSIGPTAFGPMARLRSIRRTCLSSTTRGTCRRRAGFGTIGSRALCSTTGSFRA
jgi:hypothetical protein